MKICIAQTQSLKGKIQENIKNHLSIIENAIQWSADLIIFPELSITNYEPELAKELAINIEDSRFDPFQELSNDNAITIGVGVPVKGSDGIYISMLIFQPGTERTVYSKEMLHNDELSYFAKGKNQSLLDIKGEKIAIGICYETLQREHFVKATESKANIYIASVAKSDNGIDKAYLHFPNIAKEFKTPILMSNCIGYCDNFVSVGKSSIWNKKGELISQLDNTHQGILMYDIGLEITTLQILNNTDVI